MPPIQPTDPPDVRIAISLAAVTYLEENASREEQRKRIESYLAAPDLPMEGQWSLVWGPAAFETNYWYVAEKAGGQHAALVIRGTKMDSPVSLFEDLDIVQVPAPLAGAPAGAKVGRGFAAGLERLTAARDDWTHLDAYTFLRERYGALPGFRLDVVGHSLGGALAPMVALDAKSRFPGWDVRPFSFGGQSSGNRVFADWYDQSFPGFPTRYVTPLDIIPMWYANLRGVQETYQGGPACPEWLRSELTRVMAWMASEGIEYAEPARPHVFQARLYTGLFPLFEWEQQAAAQHQDFYYMFLAGVQASVIQRRIARSWEPPREI